MDTLEDGGVLLSHPPFCPILHLSQDECTQLPSTTLTRGVDVGVVGLIQSTDRRILLTRRADHMRTFPRTWVPPGGHIEVGKFVKKLVFLQMVMSQKCYVLGKVFTPSDYQWANLSDTILCCTSYSNLRRQPKN